MKRLALILAILMALPAAARAECYVHYKAKQDSPLRLHYGILALGTGGCPGPAAAERQTGVRLADGGWTLLNIVTLSETAPGDADKANAGDFYLRF